MAAEHDYAVRELGQLKPRLRHDLIFSPHRAGGDAYYIVEDPVSSKFHRIGLAEYAFVSLLDGKMRVSDVLQKLASTSPEYALSEHEATSICKWLVESGLAHTAESSRANQLLAQAEDGQRRAALQRWNPIMFRLPLFRPDRFFEALVPWLGWMHTPLALAGWSVVALTAIYQVATHWDRFVVSSRGILSPGNWLWLLASWIVLKFIHETSHGVVCKRYGGAVREAGVLMILFAPIAYVDVTASWRFRSKWQRIQTAAAGMVIELLVAALAALLWSATDAGTLNNVCHNVIVMASFTTVVFNANPLMRFDGYYIFADLMEIPNLYSGGQQYLSYWGRKYLLGVSATRPSWSRSRARLLTTYGIAALCWRVVVCAGLIIAAASLLHGAGIVLAGLALVLWCGLPALRFGQYLLGGKSTETPSVLRLLATAGTGTVAGVLLLTVVPWPGLSRAPAVVEYDPLTVVRARSPGFVQELRVHSGQRVEEGEVIAVLANDQLQLDLVKLDTEIEQARLKCRMFKQSQKMAAYQAELKNLESLQTKRYEKADQVDQLIVRAPSSGQVLGRNLAALAGTYMSQGAEVTSIGNEQQKELRLSVGQEDHDVFRDYVGQAVRVRIGSGKWLHARLDHLDPRARLELPHRALGAACGGPLPVKKDEVASAEKEEAPVDRYRLLAPRFTGSVALSPAQSTGLHAGQLAAVTIRACHESIGSHLYNLVARWVRRRAQR